MKNTLETRLGLFFALALVVAAIVLQMVGGIAANASGIAEMRGDRSQRTIADGDVRHLYA